MYKNTLLISFLTLATLLPMQTEGGNSANSGRQSRPKTTLRTQQQASKKKPANKSVATRNSKVSQSADQGVKSAVVKGSVPQKTSKQAEDMTVIGTNKVGEVIVEKKILGWILLKGTEEEVQRQEERVLKRMAELKQEEATTPKIVQEPGRFPIKIIGSEKFIKKTEEALALIQEKSPRSYEIVTNNLSIIQSAQASGVDVFGKTFSVGPLISGSSTVDYGSSIVHDAYHSKLYWDYRREHPGHKGFVKGVFSGQEAEDKCIDVQIDFLRDANAPEHIIRGVRLAKHCDYFTIERTW